MNNKYKNEKKTLKNIKKPKYDILKNIDIEFTDFRFEILDSLTSFGSLD